MSFSVPLITCDYNYGIATCICSSSSFTYLHVGRMSDMIADLMYTIHRIIVVTVVSGVDGDFKKPPTQFSFQLVLSLYLFSLSLEDTAVSLKAYLAKLRYNF